MNIPEPDERWRFMSREGALALLKWSRELLEVKETLPPEIEAKRQEVSHATRQAELFMSRTGAVDYTLVYIAVDLRMELDTLCAHYGENPARQTLH